jgi:hypothetical protein
MVKQATAIFSTANSRFCKWSRKSYAVFASLSACVTIAALDTRMVQQLSRKTPSGQCLRAALTSIAGTAPLPPALFIAPIFTMRLQTAPQANNQEPASAFSYYLPPSPLGITAMRAFLFTYKQQNHESRTDTQYKKRSTCRAQHKLR